MSVFSRKALETYNTNNIRLILSLLFFFNSTNAAMMTNTNSITFRAIGFFIQAFTFNILSILFIQQRTIDIIFRTPPELIGTVYGVFFTTIFTLRKC